MNFSLLTLTPESPLFEKQRVFKLRYEIYIKEKNLPLQASGDWLADEYDNYSYNFLLLADGQDVGTARITFARHGNLEIMDQNAIWKDYINKYIDQEQVCIGEFNRLMVKRSHRGTVATVKLLLGALDLAKSLGGEVGFVAAEDRLSRFYQRYGAELCLDSWHPYFIQGNELGLYQLLRIDLRGTNPGIARLPQLLLWLENT